MSVMDGEPINEIQLEIAFLSCLTRNRPIGQHRDTVILKLQNDLYLRTGVRLELRDIWGRLEGMYDMKGLDSLNSHLLAPPEHTSHQPAIPPAIEQPSSAPTSPDIPLSHKHGHRELAEGSLSPTTLLPQLANTDESDISPSTTSYSLPTEGGSHPGSSSTDKLRSRSPSGSFISTETVYLNNHQIPPTSGPIPGPAREPTYTFIDPFSSTSMESSAEASERRGITPAGSLGEEGVKHWVSGRNGVRKSLGSVGDKRGHGGVGSESSRSAASAGPSKKKRRR